MSLEDLYPHVLYASMMMAVGDGMDITTTPEVYFACVTTLFGMTMLAVLVSNMAVLMANMNASEREFREAVGAMSDEMRILQVPLPLRKRVLDYYEYLFEQQPNLINGPSWISKFPKYIQSELMSNLHIRTMRKVSIFENVSRGFLAELSLRLRQKVFLKKEFIFRQGDYGDNMYFLEHGHVIIYQETKRKELTATDTEDGQAGGGKSGGGGLQGGSFGDKGGDAAWDAGRQWRRRGGMQTDPVPGMTPLVELGPGDAFGELALFFTQPRSAGAVARTVVTAMSVDKSDVDEFLHNFTSDCHGPLAINLSESAGNKGHWLVRWSTQAKQFVRQRCSAEESQDGGGTRVEAFGSNTVPAATAKGGSAGLCGNGISRDEFEELKTQLGEVTGVLSQMMARLEQLQPPSS
jgi:CRP-like cAMP-binding protein